MQSRAQRRHDLQRMKAKARRVFGTYHGVKDNLDRCEHLANHLAHCSRMCCQNERKVFGTVTMQERRAFQAERC